MSPNPLQFRILTAAGWLIGCNSAGLTRNGEFIVAFAGERDSLAGGIAMASKDRPSFSKRQKEQARQAARKRKDERRELRKSERADRPKDASP